MQESIKTSPVIKRRCKTIHDALSVTKTKFNIKIFFFRHTDNNVLLEGFTLINQNHFFSKDLKKVNSDPLIYHIENYILTTLQYILLNAIFNQKVPRLMQN